MDRTRGKDEKMTTALSSFFSTGLFSLHKAKNEGRNYNHFQIKDCCKKKVIKFSVTIQKTSSKRLTMRQGGLIRFRKKHQTF